jgi:hypothetical protein
VITHTWSNDDPIDCTPYLEVRPYVGFAPTNQHNAAGKRTLHAVSVPSAAIAIHDATATADHDDDHHGTLSFASGLHDAPYAEYSPELPIANSSIFALPIMIHQAASNFLNTVAL